MKDPTHLVLAPTTTGRLSHMAEGTRSHCETFIRRRARYGKPTHFCYIVRNTFRAIEAFAKKHHLR